MQLDLESGLRIQSPSDADFAKIGGEEFAILSGSDSNTYIQCAEQSGPPWEYVLEYQDGSLERHYAAKGPITIEQIVSAFRKYRDGDESWLTDFDWERMDLS